MTKTTYENEIITETVVASNLLSGMSIGTIQADFLLNEADFIRLKSQESQITTWALNILFAGIGYGLSILPKFINSLAGKGDVVSLSEWAVLIICIVVSGSLFIAGRFLPTEKSALLKKMEAHFKSAPKSQQIIRGQQ